MKTLKIPAVATWAIVCAMAFPVTSFAKDHKKHKHHHDDDSSKSQKGDHGNGQGDNRWSQQNNDRWNNNWNHQQRSYGQNCTTPSISGLLLSLVSGLSQAPQVRYYAPAAPRTYYGYGNRSGISLEASVQLALVRAGYYNGPIDGCVGPGTRQAIANYQASRGLRITGNINDNLLAALGL